MDRKIKIGLLTTGRMDWSYCSPLARELKNHKEIKLSLILTGTHLINRKSNTLKEVIKEGFYPDVKIKLNLSGDSPISISKSMAEGVKKFAEAFHKNMLDILIVNGDRVETLSAVVASKPFNIVVAHIGGGERTEGVMDEDMRHAITKMSHLHFTECQEYKNRVIQMGEDKSRVFNVGSLSIESMKDSPLLFLDNLRRRLGYDIEDNFLLVTFHPVTLKGYIENKKYISNLLAALKKIGLYCVFTYPNVDTNNAIIIKKIREFIKDYRRGCFIVNAGKNNYYSLMRLCRAMVGNSSSGIIESPYFKIPTVDIGDRQKGRVKAANIVGTGYEFNRIVKAINSAISDKFKIKIKQTRTPFYNNNISYKIANILIKQYNQYGNNLIVKTFRDN